MSEPLVVPEPSREALRAITPLATGPESLRAAYAVDVPGIVRAEVERALALTETELLGAGLGGGVRVSSGWLTPAKVEYVNTRFPEPPEQCGKFVSGITLHCPKPLHHPEPCGVDGSVPAPSAETATPEPLVGSDCVEGCRWDRGIAVHMPTCPKRLRVCTACPCARCQSEREFVRALAKFCAQRYERLSPRLFLAEVCRRDRAVTAAARRVTEGR